MEKWDPGLKKNKITEFPNNIPGRFSLPLVMCWCSPGAVMNETENAFDHLKPHLLVSLRTLKVFCILG